MRTRPAWRVTPSLLLLAAAGACARPPAARSYGTVEIPLTGADAAGTPHRLHGELTFSSVDDRVVRSASTRTSGTSEVLQVPLPAGLYTLTLDADLVVESAVPCSAGGAGPRLAWVDSVKPPLVGVTGGQVTRVRFHLVPTDLPPARAGHEQGSSAARQGRSSGTCSSSDWHAAEAALRLRAS